MLIFIWKKLYAILALLLLFLRELLLSSIAVIRQVIRPRLHMKPGIFALPTELRGNWEITALALLITLTPGTLAMEVSEQNEIIYIHAMNIENKEEAIKQIKNSFEKAIMEVTRK